MFSTDPEFLTLVFAGVAGLAVVYYAIYQIYERIRIRALGLVKGTSRITLSDGSECDVEFKPHRGSGAWDLILRVSAMQPRNYRIPLPIPETGAFAKLDRETIEFGRQAFENGMDWIRQDELVLEIGSRSFRPTRHGHAGFIDRLGKGLGKIDWKLAADEGEGTLHGLTRPSDMGARAFALFAGLFTLLASFFEPVVNHGASVLDPSPAYAGALCVGLAIFVYRRRALRGRYRDLKRKPPVFADCFWPAFSGGMLALIPIEHLNVKLDASAPLVVSAQVTRKEAVEGLTGTSYVVRVRRADGPGAWSVELSQDDYAAAKTGATLLNLKIHPGAFGMEWLERAALEDVDRNVASSPNDRAPVPPLGK